MFQYSLQVIHVMMAGHLGKLALSSASIAAYFAGFMRLHVVGMIYKTFY